MRLTQHEQDMLDGAFGPGVALAMKVQVAVGEAVDAERMVPITRAHAALSNQDADLWFAEKLVGLGARCVVPPTVNPGFNVTYFQEKTGLLPEDAEMMNRTHEAYKKLGAILTYNCTPYLEKNVPFYGEIISFSESSATPFVNSVYGARTNRESAQSALCAAITGVVPLYGFLLDENRKGQVLVDVQAKIEDDFDYQLLGYLTPKKIGYRTPVFANMPQNPSQAALMNLGAQLNTGGNVAMYHILGLTPEAKTFGQAFGDKDPEKTVVVTDDDMRAMHEALTEQGGKIDFALFGCPHMTLPQVGAIAGQVRGKKLAVPLYVMTSTLTLSLAERMGYLDDIREAGGDLVDATCMDQPCWRFLYGKKGVTDSPKCAYYTKRRDMAFVVRKLSDCVDAALKGEA